MSYAKLFSSIIHSTVWRESPHVKILWITMLAMADKDGAVMASIPGLADAARVTLEQCHEGLQRLQESDLYSRTKENDGKRIIEIDGGWALLNYPKYRDLKSEEENKEKNRVRVANWRARQKQIVTKPVTESNQCNKELPNVTDSNPLQIYTTDTKEEKKEADKLPPVASGSRKSRGQVIGDYSPEFEQADTAWRNLFRETKPLIDGIPSDRVHVASAPGSKAASWSAWKRLLTCRVNGSGLVQPSDLLEAVKGHASAKLARARNGTDLNLPMFSTLLNKPEMLDAVVHIIKNRREQQWELHGITTNP